MHRSRFLLCLAAGLLSLSSALPACKSNPLNLPTLAVTRVEPVFTESRGFVARVHGTAHNPNPVALPVRSVHADVSVSGQNAADVQSTSLSTLAPNADSPVAFDVTVPWRQISLLASRSGGVDPVPYTVTGTATVGAAGAEIDLPFSQTGTVKKADIAIAALKFLPVDLERLKRARPLASP